MSAHSYGSAPKRERERAAGEADDRDVALGPTTAAASASVVVGADEVEHDLGAAPAGQLADLRGGVRRRRDAVVGADLARQLELLGSRGRRR